MTIRDMVKRNLPADDRQYIPTPGYATRVLFELVAPELKKVQSAWDPACGGFHMTRVFNEYCFNVRGTDIITGTDYFNTEGRAELVATNPPYKFVEGFMRKAYNDSLRYMAMLVRVQCLEGQGRYKFYSAHPPTQIAFFSDRIPFRVGRTVRKAPKMFFHMWLFWDKEAEPRPPMWLPPDIQKRFEKDEDYDK